MALASDSDDIHPRGWKASENAERDAVMMMDSSHGLTDHAMPMELPSAWYWDTQFHVKVVTTCIIVFLPVFIAYVWKYAVSRQGRRTRMREFLYQRRIRVEDTVDSNGDSVGKHDVPSAIIRNKAENDDSGGACSCSNMTPQQQMVPATQKGNGVVPDGGSDGTDGDDSYSEVMSKRIDEAAGVLNLIHSKIPDTASSAEKVAYAHLYFEAMKVNESCKATSSMQRMESIAKEGNNIQKSMYSMRKEEYLEEQMKTKAKEFSKMAMDIMCTGIVIMLLSGAFTAWYSGSIGYRIEVCAEQSSAMLRWSSPPSSVWSMLSGIVAVSHAIACYITHAVQAVQAVVILTLTPIVITKLGTFDSHAYSSMPVFRIGTTFGIICGISGRFAVQWLGGHANRWLLLWEIWIIVFIAAFTLSKSISTCNHAPILRILMWTCLGVIYPIIMGRVIY
ncbi:hypothetical protein M9434_001059 [Picochlorum sp. BPE23]|nr:hypothetical protein M9434_001059 [Picochlorum sp. BPE23]